MTGETDLGRMLASLDVEPAAIQFAEEFHSTDFTHGQPYGDIMRK